MKQQSMETECAQSVTGLAAGSSPSIVVKNTNTGGISAGCPNTFACTDAVGSCPEDRSARISSPQQIESSISTTTVKAYPNPFSDRVKFMVTSTVAGNGNLEIYNMMGQKVKTVYQGISLQVPRYLNSAYPASKWLIWFMY
jgi:hypothetical protein